MRGIFAEVLGAHPLVRTFGGTGDRFVQRLEGVSREGGGGAKKNVN